MRLVEPPAPVTRHGPRGDAFGEPQGAEPRKDRKDRLSPGPPPAGGEVGAGLLKAPHKSRR